MLELDLQTINTNRKTMRNSLPRLHTVFAVLLLSTTLLASSAIGQTDYSGDIAQVRLQILEIQTESGELAKKVKQVSEELSEINEQIAATEEKKRNALDSLKEKDLTQQDSRRAKFIQLKEYEQRTIAIQVAMPVYMQMTNHDNLTIAIRDNDVNSLSRSQAYLRYLTKNQLSLIEELYRSMDTTVGDNSDAAKLVLHTTDLKNQLAKQKAVRSEIKQRLDVLETRQVTLAAKLDQLRDEEELLTSNQVTISKKAIAQTVSSQVIKLQPPIDAPIRRKFGEPKNSSGSRWDGLLYQAKAGQGVKAPAAGVVKFAKDHKTLGKLLIIDHGNNLYTLFAHNDHLEVKFGELVVVGQTIAKAGQTGNLNDPALYFELRVNGEPVDPLLWIDG